jgi:ribonuclease P protein component
VTALTPEGGSNSYGKSGKKNPRNGRLLRHADFEQVYKQGRKHFSPNITVFYLRRADGEGMRVGFTVSRALGDAVDRNRMKRRLRESVRLTRPRPSPAVDVVINPKKSVRTMSFSILVGEVNRAFEVIVRKSSEKPRNLETSGGRTP